MLVFTRSTFGPAQKPREQLILELGLILIADVSQPAALVSSDFCELLQGSASGAVPINMKWFSGHPSALRRAVPHLSHKLSGVAHLLPHAWVCFASCRLVKCAKLQSRTCLLACVWPKFQHCSELISNPTSGTSSTAGLIYPVLDPSCAPALLAENPFACIDALNPSPSTPLCLQDPSAQTLGCL